MLLHEGDVDGLIALIAGVVNNLIPLFFVAGDEVVVGGAQSSEVIIRQMGRSFCHARIVGGQGVFRSLLGLGAEATERCRDHFGREFVILGRFVHLRGGLLHRIIVGGRADDGGIGAAHSGGQRARVTEHRRHARLHGGVCVPLRLGARIGSRLLGPLLDILDELLALFIQVFELRGGAYRRIRILLHIVDDRHDSLVDPVDPCPFEVDFEGVGTDDIAIEQFPCALAFEDTHPHRVGPQIATEMPIRGNERDISGRILPQEVHHAFDVIVSEIALEQPVQFGRFGARGIGLSSPLLLFGSTFRNGCTSKQRPELS